MKNKESQKNTKSSSGSSREVVVPITDSMKRKFFLHQLIFFIFHIIRLSLTILIIIFIAYSSLTPIIQLDVYDRLQQNLNLWNKDVIIDIITVSSYNCPDAYQMYSFVEWPGINEGCQCKTVLNDYDYIHVLPGTCFGKLIDAGCTQIQSKQSIPFSFWQANNLICIKRINGLNFYTKLQQNSSIKSCGSGDYEILSIKDVDCPISQVKNTTQLQTNLQQIQFSYQRQNNYPIIDIKASQYVFCVQYNRSNISPNRFQNYNLQPIQISTCQQKDPRVIEIDQKTQKQLFQDNNRILQTINSLPVYPQPSQDYIYKLGMVRYPPWKLSCRNSQTHSLQNAFYFMNLQTFAQVINLQVSIIIVLSIICGIISSFLSLVKHIYELKSRYNSNLHYVPQSEIDKINPNYRLQINYHYQVFKITLFLILHIILIIVISVHYNSMENMYEWYKGGKQCTEQDMIIWLSQIIYKIQEIQRQILKCILMVVIILLLDTINIIWRCHKSDLSHKSNKIIQQEISQGSRMVDVWSEKQKKVINMKNIQKRQQTQQSLNSDTISFVSKQLRLSKIRNKRIDFSYSDYD